jgi:hypothetical protein
MNLRSLILGLRRPRYKPNSCFPFIYPHPLLRASSSFRQKIKPENTHSGTLPAKPVLILSRPQTRYGATRTNCMMEAGTSSGEIVVPLLQGHGVWSSMLDWRAQEDFTISVNRHLVGCYSTLPNFYLARYLVAGFLAGRCTGRIWLSWAAVPPTLPEIFPRKWALQPTNAPLLPLSNWSLTIIKAHFLLHLMNGL